MTNKLCVEKKLIESNQTTQDKYLNIYSLHPEHQKRYPTVYFQANMHGSEIQGNAVIYELIHFLKGQELKAHFYFIPFCNPYSVSSKSGFYTQGRYSDLNGQNWNRHYQDFISNEDVLNFCKKFLTCDDEQLIKDEFKDYLSKKINEKLNILATNNYYVSDSIKLPLNLQALSIQADFVFDLHTGHRACEYLYVPEFCFHQAKELNFSINIIIPESFYGSLDEASFIPWVKLRNTFKQLGRDFLMDFESYTIELGSEEILDFNLAQVQAKKILNYLKSKKLFKENEQQVLSKRPNEIQYYSELNHFKDIYAPKTGQIEFLARPLELVKKGSPLARYLNFNQLFDETLNTSSEDVIKAPSDCILVNLCPSGNVQAGMLLFQVIEHFKPY